MKRLNKTLMSVLLAGMTLVSCGSTTKTLITFDSQLDAVTQLANGTVDVAVIDSVMAGYYSTTGDFANTIQMVDNLVLSTEQYGIAGRKSDVAFMDKINEGLLGTFASGEMNKIASYFGVSNSMVIDNTTKYAGTATDTSWDKIVESKKIVVGYTVFAPIAYTDKTSNYIGDEFTGFDTELARGVVAYLNTTYSASLTLEFKEIDWDSKEALLTNGTIDLIWNGLTITDERKENMSISIPYLNNNQVAVVRKADSSKFTSKDSLINATIGVESGSAGEDAAKAIKGL